MLYLVKRIFKGGKCVGYYVSDGRKTLSINLDTVIRYALQGRIRNVAVRNVKGQQILYGTNGFSIEKLEVEKLDSKENKEPVKTVTDTATNAATNANNLLKVLEVISDDSGAIGYVLELHGKIASVTPVQYRAYIRKNRVDTSTLERAKKVYCGSNLFEQSGIKDKARDCVRAMRESGDDNAIPEIISLVNNAESTAKAWNGTKADFGVYLDNILKYLELKLEGVSSKLFQKRIETAFAVVGKAANDAATLMTDKRHVYLAELKSIGMNLSALGAYNDINDFNRDYDKLRDKLRNLRASLDADLKTQEQIRSGIRQLREASNKLIAALDKNDELYNEKVIILNEPWCYKNIKFLEGSKYLKNCFITPIDNPEKMIASLASVQLKLTYTTKGDYSGFDLAYRGKKYHYNKRFNNFNLIAAFIRAMDDAGKLNGNDLNISVDSNGGIKNIKFIVREH